MGVSFCSLSLHNNNFSIFLLPSFLLCIYWPCVRKRKTTLSHGVQCIYHYKNVISSRYLCDALFGYQPFELKTNRWLRENGNVFGLWPSFFFLSEMNRAAHETGPSSCFTAHITIINSEVIVWTLFYDL